jgi:hypothetical protein
VFLTDLTVKALPSWWGFFLSFSKLENESSGRAISYFSILEKNNPGMQKN